MAEKAYAPTEKQTQAVKLIGGDAIHTMLFGGSRSGKSVVLVRSLLLRALSAPGSRHAILRFRFNHVKASIVHDTFPKVMSLCFPQVEYKIDKTDWFCALPNGSQVWFGGLDDKERTEKILGQEYATIFLNECSQIPWGSRNLAMTRLAQQVDCSVGGVTKPLRLKVFYDCNPPSKAHWSYKLFIQGIDPESGKKIPNPEQYAHLKMNPKDNEQNIAAEYMAILNAMPARLRSRFLEGNFADITENALWNIDIIDRWRSDSAGGSGDLPDMQRIIVAVDPSGAGDKDNANNDAIGIIVAGLGTDGNAYVLEDLTVKAGPKTWGNVVATAFDRHEADLVVAEKNYGGAMVKFVIQTARPRTPYRDVNASRGKAVRAEPISALTEQGRVRFVGQFPELEDELCAFTTQGYIGDKSPNRADAFIWAMTELFPGVIKAETRAARKKAAMIDIPRPSGMTGWMGL